MGSLDVLPTHPDQPRHPLGAGTAVAAHKPTYGHLNRRTAQNIRQGFHRSPRRPGRYPARDKANWNPAQPLAIATRASWIKKAVLGDPPPPALAQYQAPAR